MAAVNGLGGAAAFKNGFRLKNSGLYVGRFKKTDRQKRDLFKWTHIWANYWQRIYVFLINSIIIVLELEDLEQIIVNAGGKNNALEYAPELLEKITCFF